MISLYLGGARSGKSGHAEQEVIESGLPASYIATARASQSMASRIALHQQQRPKTWATLEVPLALAETISQLDSQHGVIIVDCLTLWLTNQLMAKHDLVNKINQLCHTLSELKGQIVLVSTEVGQSLIPDDQMSQEFVHYSGLMHQQIAAIADKVTFVQSGRSISLKEPINSLCNQDSDIKGALQVGV